MTDEQQRTIKSFVKRQGRITEGQKKALDELMQRYGLELTEGAIDFEKYFDRSAPVALEIGCGNGDTMIAMASEHPEINFIGCEVYAPGVGRLLANIEKNNLTNVRVAMHDAVEVLRNHINDHTLAKVMIYFPDPWPKKRHHKRRLIQDNFVKLLVQKLTPGGELHLATDWQNYAEQMLVVCNNNPNLKNLAQDNQYIDRPDFRPLTKFEQRGKNLGHDVWDLIFQKT